MRRQTSGAPAGLQSVHVRGLEMDEGAESVGIGESSLVPPPSPPRGHHRRRASKRHGRAAAAWGARRGLGAARVPGERTTCRGPVRKSARLVPPLYSSCFYPPFFNILCVRTCAQGSTTQRKHTGTPFWRLRFQGAHGTPGGPAAALGPPGSGGAGLRAATPGSSMRPRAARSKMLPVGGKKKKKKKVGGMRSGRLVPGGVTLGEIRK